MKIQVYQEQLDEMFEHGEKTYPEECCGVLIADVEYPGIVMETREMENINAGSKNTRYNIDPLELMKLEDELDESKKTMVGIYHSHPDHPARPSEYDLNHAWPNLSYMVMRTADGVTEKITSWRLDDNNDEFIEEEIEIILER